MNAEETDIVKTDRPHELRFRKGERLRHRTLVEGLFAEGKSIYEYPLRCVWRKISSEELSASFRDEVPDRIGPVQMMVTVPKKKLRHAVDRVLMRRRIREAYRLNRLPLLKTVAADDKGSRILMAFVYLHNDTLPFDEVATKMQGIMSRLMKKL